MAEESTYQRSFHVLALLVVLCVALGDGVLFVPPKLCGLLVGLSLQLLLAVKHVSIIKSSAAVLLDLVLSFWTLESRLAKFQMQVDVCLLHYHVLQIHTILSVLSPAFLCKRYRHYPQKNSPSFALLYPMPHQNSCLTRSFP